MQKELLSPINIKSKEDSINDVDRITRDYIVRETKMTDLRQTSKDQW